jgi:hypothetical protein
MRVPNHSRAEGYRQEAARLRQQAVDTQHPSMRISLLVRAQQFDALAAGTDDPRSNRSATDRRLRLRFRNAMVLARGLLPRHERPAEAKTEALKAATRTQQISDK